MFATEPYKPKQFNLSGLKGISDQTLEMHFKLYEGYVKETNKLEERIAEFLKDGKVDHKYCLGNMIKNAEPNPAADSAFRKAAESSFGSYEIWKTDFAGVGKMRGVGWAICFEQPDTGRLSNHWISLHQSGEVAGFNPVLVMDVWEHAFLLDYKPADRPKYIEAFFSNMDWNAIEKRLKYTKGKAQVSR